VNVIGDDVVELDAGEAGLFFDNAQFGELHFGAGEGMIVHDVLPDLERGVGFVQRRQRFGVGHERVAEVVLEIFAADGVEQRAGLGGTLQPQQALAKMRAGVNVVWLALQRGAVAFFRLGEFSLLKINVAELEMMVGVVEVMDFGLQFLDAGAALRAGQLKAAGGRGGTAIDGKVIPKRAQPGTDENKKRPKPFAVAQGVDQHPELETRHRQPDRTGQQIAPVTEDVEK